MHVSSGDTAWVLVSSALVLLMTPGLALFYGGMARRKNLLSTIMMSFAIMSLVGVIWVLWGYSLSFGSDKGGFVGSLNFLGLMNIGLEPSDVYATSIPHLVFVAYTCQCQRREPTSCFRWWLSDTRREPLFSPATSHLLTGERFWGTVSLLRPSWIACYIIPPFLIFEETATDFGRRKKS